MKKMTISFSPPDITEAEVAEVAEALRSGWITTGPRTKELEKRLAAYVGTSKCVCLNSATAALELALRVLGIGPGDEVITSAYTYTASASVIDHVGAKIVLVDTQPDNLQMDYDLLSAAITERTKAIIPVDIAGVPCDCDKIFAIVNDKKQLFHATNDIQKALGRIAVITDAAHALGASRGGKMVGSITDFTCYSFHAVKNFTTAEGGAVVWRDIPGIDNEELYKEFQLLSLHGQNKDALAKTKLGAWEYDIIGTYYKCNMTDIMAAIGLVQLNRYPGMLARRKELIAKYDAVCDAIGVKHLVHDCTEYHGSRHLYMARVPGINHQQRCEIIEKMAERGIACNVHFKPLPLMTAYKALGFDIKDYPNAYANYENEITLPLHTKLTDEEAGYVIENFADIVKGYLG